MSQFCGENLIEKPKTCSMISFKENVKKCSYRKVNKDSCDTYPVFKYRNFILKGVLENYVFNFLNVEICYLIDDYYNALLQANLYNKMAN